MREKTCCETSRGWFYQIIENNFDYSIVASLIFPDSAVNINFDHSFEVLSNPRNIFSKCLNIVPGNEDVQCWITNQSVQKKCAQKTYSASRYFFHIWKNNFRNRYICVQQWALLPEITSQQNFSHSIKTKSKSKTCN